MLGFNHTREWVYPQSISGAFMRLALEQAALASAS